uniref:ER membrane protein complex subunit 10 n=1 Tax=Trichobilharzia regenti TaxID=157069 RepID=A0AA85KKE4_TRIRE|nr:unnamed protein product [Trichobilharzia regenti]
MFLAWCLVHVLSLSSVYAYDNSASTYLLEHSLLEDGAFSQLNGIMIKSSSGVLSLVSDGHSFTANEKQLLLESAKAGRLYTIRIPISDKEFVESSILACQLVASRMKLKLTLSVNDVGNPVAIHLSTSKYDCPSDTSINHLDLPDISVNFEIQKPKLGSSPETAKYLERLERQREEMARAEQSDNRSFFAKYCLLLICT